jgi:hypothetical protein
LDRECAKKTDELQTMKDLLSKGHLQILRTREETLRIEDDNALRKFRIRCLRQEIARLLPYVDDEGPTNDYILPMDKPSDQPSRTFPPTKPDARFSQSLDESLSKWQEILATQETVFEEEHEHRATDAAYFEKFYEDFCSQNQEAHKNIDHLLDTLVRRTLQEQNAAETVSSTQKEVIEAIKRRHQHLGQVMDGVKATAEERKIQGRQKAIQRAAKQTAQMRDRVKAHGQDHEKAHAALLQHKMDLEAQCKELKANVGVLEQKERKLKRDSEMTRTGMEKIRELENKLNAIVSVASTTSQIPNHEHRKVLAAVGSAIGSLTRKSSDA